MAERCLCSSAGAFDCEGGGLPPAPDGACSCACHGGAEATDAVAAPEPECTGETARWCPRCGDCTCPARDGWPDELTFDGDDCPLHGERSSHAEDATETAEESLAREVSELRSQLASERLRASQVPGLTAELDQLRWELAVAKGERDALRAILAGRTTPPTDAEIHTHWTAGGVWIVQGVTVLRSLEDVTRYRDQSAWAAVVWVPFRDGRPCAWPEVTT